MQDVINKIVKLIDYRGKVINKVPRSADVETHNSSNAKIKSMIDYQLTDFESGLANTVKWYQDNLTK